MGGNSEPKAATVLFLVTWWTLSQEATVFGQHAFLSTVVLFVVGWLTARVVRTRLVQLGAAGWHLLGQLAAWFVLYCVTLPAGPLSAFGWAWALGAPCLLIGMGARWTYDRVPNAVREAGKWIAALVSVTGLSLVYSVAHPSGGGIASDAAFLIITACPLYYGWRFAMGELRHQHDAAYGKADEFRSAGMADER